MYQIDNDFFEAYKHLDKICKEIFNCGNGISEYISEMEKSSCGQYKVASWTSDYKSLKHIRWVRNQIAHDTSDYVHSDQGDLEFTEMFYDRIMNQEDPLAQLRKIEQLQQNHSTIRNTSKRIPDTPVNSNSENNSKANHFWVLWIFAIMLFLILLFMITR